jgi:succinyl-CoA synthetase beta subunit
MARLKLTEYRAKKLILGDTYRGSSLYGTFVPKLPKGKYVLKVDQGVKKRMKQGLVLLNLSPKHFAAPISRWKKKGFTQFLAEPMLPHTPHEERYLSLERVRDGIRLLYAREGGIDIEAHPEKVETHVLKTVEDAEHLSKKLDLPKEFLGSLLEAFGANFFAFLEINPLVIQDGTAYLLDAAVLVDDAGEFFVEGAWTTNDLVRGASTHAAEARVASLQETSPASLKLSVLNRDGSLFFLLSGGGGSIVIADEAHAKGKGRDIGNYGEYSGGPTREETYLYAKEVLALMLGSRAKKKALVIAGGVANFTDVKSTFAGIIDALSEVAHLLRKGGVRVYVRRGGPREAEGLALMEAFLKKEKLLGSVYGSDALITSAVDDAISYV